MSETTLLLETQKQEKNPFKLENVTPQVNLDNDLQQVKSAKELPTSLRLQALALDAISKNSLNNTERDRVNKHVIGHRINTQIQSEYGGVSKVNPASVKYPVSEANTFGQPTGIETLQRQSEREYLETAKRQSTTEEKPIPEKLQPIFNELKQAEKYRADLIRALYKPTDPQRSSSTLEKIKTILAGSPEQKGLLKQEVSKIDVDKIKKELIALVNSENYKSIFDDILTPLETIQKKVKSVEDSIAKSQKSSQLTEKLNEAKRRAKIEAVAEMTNELLDKAQEPLPTDKEGVTKASPIQVDKLVDLGNQQIQQEINNKIIQPTLEESKKLSIEDEQKKLRDENLELKNKLTTEQGKSKEIAQNLQTATEEFDLVKTKVEKIETANNKIERLYKTNDIRHVDLDVIFIDGKPSALKIKRDGETYSTDPEGIQALEKRVEKLQSKLDNYAVESRPMANNITRFFSRFSWSPNWPNNPKRRDPSVEEIRKLGLQEKSQDIQNDLAKVITHLKVVKRHQELLDINIDFSSNLKYTLERGLREVQSYSVIEQAKSPLKNKVRKEAKKERKRFNDLDIASNNSEFLSAVKESSNSVNSITDLVSDSINIYKSDRPNVSLSSLVNNSKILRSDMESKARGAKQKLDNLDQQAKQQNSVLVGLENNIKENNDRIKKLEKIV